MVPSSFEITRPSERVARSKAGEDGVLVERLTSTDRAKILEAAGSLVERERISSVAAYGPKVAGYDGESSNYQIMIVVKDFGERTKYLPSKDPAQSSALLVDETDLLADARRAALGESVIGKLLNVYEPVLNPELLRSAEVEYKKRVTAEELIVLQSDYGVFTPELIVAYGSEDARSAGIKTLNECCRTAYFAKNFYAVEIVAFGTDSADAALAPFRK